MADANVCPFCNPKQRILKENEHAYVLLSNPRKVPGHFLIIPKRHVEKPWELSRSEIGDIFDLIGFVEQRIIGKISEGADIRQHYMPYVTQGRTKVNHVHFHVLPRSFKDALYENGSRHEDILWQDLSPEEHDEIAKLLD